MQAYWGQTLLLANKELCFSCTLEGVRRAKIRLIAKDIYNLFVNGEFVCYGPARTAKGYARVDEIALDNYLTREKNEICVFVQSNYTNALNVAFEKPLFGAEIISEQKTIKTAADFTCREMTDRVRLTERMCVQRGFTEVYRMKKDRFANLSGYPELELVEVTAPKLLERGVEFSKNELLTAEKYEEGGVIYDENAVWQNPLVNVLESGDGLRAYKRSECECNLSKELPRLILAGGEVEGEYRYEAYSIERVRCGKFKIELSAMSDADMWLVYDDILVGGKLQFNREQIIHGLKWSLKAGDYALYSQEVYSAKYITLIIKGEAKIKSVSVICVENPQTSAFNYRSEDGELNEIITAAKHTFEQNAYDIFTDCPSRERAGYLCDGYFTAEAERFFTGDNRVEKNFFENYLLYKNEHYEHDGIIPMCYPSEPKNKDDFLTNWILWYVLQLERYKVRTGDEKLIAASKTRVYAIMDYFSGFENEYGLLENLKGWVFVEWSKANDFIGGVNFPTNMLYCAAVAATGRLYGDENLAKKAKNIKERINALSFNGELFCDNALRNEKGELIRTNNISETCQNYACFFDIITAEENPDYYNRLLTRFGSQSEPEKVCPSNMFIGYVLRLVILLREKRYEQLLSECRHTFLNMARRTGTIWELFAENASCNHGFGSIVAMLIAEAEKGLKA